MGSSLIKICRIIMWKPQRAAHLALCLRAQQAQYELLQQHILSLMHMPSFAVWPQEQHQTRQTRLKAFRQAFSCATFAQRKLTASYLALAQCNTEQGSQTLWITGEKLNAQRQNSL